jgi:hypothetical protein
MAIQSLRDLKSDPHNRRQRTPRNQEMLEASLRTVGASRSIVIDETGEILAGNGVVEAATALGLDRVKIVDVSGDTIVAVRRSGLTPEQKRDLAIYDNRTAELAVWNTEQLAADEAAGLDLQPWFSVNETSALFDRRDTPEAQWTGMPECVSEDQAPFKSVIVNFATAADLEAFARLVEQTITLRTRSLWYPAVANGFFRDKSYTNEPDR